MECFGSGLRTARIPRWTSQTSTAGGVKGRAFSDFVGAPARGVQAGTGLYSPPMSAPLARPSKPTRLRVTDEKGFEKLILIDRDVFPIGRDAAEGLSLPHMAGDGLAPCHALIIRDGNDYVLKDESGSCGTRVNGRPIRRTVLHHGDQINLGDSPMKIRFLVDGTRAADQEEKRIRTLLEVLRVMHSCLEVREVAARAIAGVMQLLGPAWCCLSMPGDRGGLEVIAASDATGRLPQKPGRLAAQVMATGRSLFSHAALCATIRSVDGLLGVIETGPRDRAEWTSRDMEMLEALSAHVGVALTNARRLKGHPSIGAPAASGIRVG